MKINDKRIGLPICKINKELEKEGHIYIYRAYIILKIIKQTGNKIGPYGVAVEDNLTDCFEIYRGRDR